MCRDSWLSSWGGLLAGGANKEPHWEAGLQGVGSGDWQEVGLETWAKTSLWRASDVLGKSLNFVLQVLPLRQEWGRTRQAGQAQAARTRPGARESSVEKASGSERCREEEARSSVSLPPRWRQVQQRLGYPGLWCEQVSPLF